MRHWSVAEAKAKLSALLERARREPQLIRSRGEEVAVVVSVKAYQQLVRQAEAPRATPMQAWLEAVEALKAGEDLELELPPRRQDDQRPPPSLGEG